MVTFSPTLVNVALFLATVTICIIAYFKWAYGYWSRRGLPFLEPSIPFGNFENFTKPTQHIHFYVDKLYNAMKSKGEIHGGMFLSIKPIYVPVHPDCVRNILAKDFNYFVDRGMFVNEETDPLSAHIFNMNGQKWKNLRVKLTPTFTSGKMKMMFDIILKSTENMLEALDINIDSKGGIFDAKEIMGCFTMDVIGSAAFGLDCNAFKDPDSQFRTFGSKVFKPTFWDLVRGFTALILPGFATAIDLTVTNKDCSAFYMDVVRKAIDYREKNGVVRKDFLQLLMDLKNSETGGLTFNEIAAQAFIFFLAGYETSSTTMAFCLSELSNNTSIQDKVRDEIDKVLEKHGGAVTYDAIMEMKYMQQVVDETLRKYPTLPLLNRKSIEDYKIPGSDVTLEKGTFVFIPTYALHHDPEFYPNPDEFDPERFSDVNKHSRHPFTYLAFGEGPRNCIGLRFGIMQVKIGLAVLLKNYYLTLNEKTTFPLELDTSFVIGSKHKLLLNIAKR